MVDRLTDPAGYTGTQRFNAAGKAVDGKDARSQDTVKNDGYVQGYKNADTYDKDHAMTVRKNYKNVESRFVCLISKNIATAKISVLRRI